MPQDVHPFWRTLAYWSPMYTLFLVAPTVVIFTGNYFSPENKLTDLRFTVRDTLQYSIPVSCALTAVLLPVHFSLWLADRILYEPQGAALRQ